MRKNWVFAVCFIIVFGIAASIWGQMFQGDVNPIGRMIYGLAMSTSGYVILKSKLNSKDTKWMIEVQKARLQGRWEGRAEYGQQLQQEPREHGQGTQRGYLEHEADGEGGRAARPERHQEGTPS